MLTAMGDNYIDLTTSPSKYFRRIGNARSQDMSSSTIHATAAERDGLVIVDEKGLGKDER